VNNHWQSSHIYVSGVSEQIRKACEKFNQNVVFKSVSTLLTAHQSEALTPKEKLADVVYQISCQCRALKLSLYTEVYGRAGATPMNHHHLRTSPH
jgi:hypothetical protein